MTPLQFIVNSYNVSQSGAPHCPSWDNVMDYSETSEFYPSLGFGAPRCGESGPFSRFDNILCEFGCKALCDSDGVLPEKDNFEACKKGEERSEARRGEATMERALLNPIVATVSPLHLTTGAVPPLLQFTSKNDIYTVPENHGDPQCGAMDLVGVPCVNLVYDKMGHVFEAGPNTIGGQSSTYAVERFAPAIFS